MKACWGWSSGWPAETGHLSDADPILYGANKYGSLQLHIQASLLAWVEEDKLFAPLQCDEASLHRDEAPSKQILCQILVLTSYQHPNLQ